MTRQEPAAHTKVFGKLIERKNKKQKTKKVKCEYIFNSFAHSVNNAFVYVFLVLMARHRLKGESGTERNLEKERGGRGEKGNDKQRKRYENECSER